MRYVVPCSFGVVLYMIRIQACKLTFSLPTEHYKICYLQAIDWSKEAQSTQIQCIIGIQIYALQSNPKIGIIKKTVGATRYAVYTQLTTRANKRTKLTDNETSPLFFTNIVLKIVRLVLDAPALSFCSWKGNVYGWETCHLWDNSFSFQDVPCINSTKARFVVGDLTDTIMTKVHRTRSVKCDRVLHVEQICENR